MAVNDFEPCMWLANGHLQTWAGALFPRVQQDTEMESLALPDGDTLELHWLSAEQTDAPILFLLHGLEGSVRSGYIQGMLQVAKNHHWRAVLPHLRGSGGRINNISQSYHAGRTDDLDIALQHIRARYPNAPCVAVGYSLGANLLLKYLGENSAQPFIKTAIAVCAPFDLAATAAKLSQGVNKIYEHTFVESLKKTIAYKMALNMSMPIDWLELANIKTMHDFDDKITAPLHNFLNAKEYYAQSSCLQFLPNIQIPTLIINAQDDPLIPKEVIPSQKQLNQHITLDIQQHGGHVGFISCRAMGKPSYWLEERIAHYLTCYIT